MSMKYSDGADSLGLNHFFFAAFRRDFGEMNIEERCGELSCGKRSLLKKVSVA